MEMKILKKVRCLCPCCMEEHEVKTVLVEEETTFKNTQVKYPASYLYCDVAEEFYAEESQMQENDFRMKDAYRKKEGLLTSGEIKEIRAMYEINQRDLCILLGWGEKTITRYETHQVQDRAHDTILKKISHDPEWFLMLLCAAQERLSPEAYEKSEKAANVRYEKDQDAYLRRTIEASYVKYQECPDMNGNAALSLDKVVDVIRYFASCTQVISLYKVKLMKMLWYADMLAFRSRSQAITGLVYQALPMGAVPIGHNLIIDLKDVPCEEVDYGETIAYHFSLKKTKDFPFLSVEEKKILDLVAKKFGKMSKNEIVEFMHQEEAYKKTAARDVISFQYAKSLQI